MKKVILVAAVALGVIACDINIKKELNNNSNVPELETIAVEKTDSLHETFTYEEGDTTYVMQKYFMIFLKKGPNRNQDSVTLAKLQKEHLAHLEKLHLAGKISIAGPFDDNSEVLGIAVYNTPTFEEADSLANADPMVKAGRLTIESHPFWAAKGSKLK
ncbi:hypothetical protein NBRC110019_21320 [Neptunitalea chrysea]|uniref:YCII-related domain-containing protein n=1 Tax=Neptunitalea chrysea TaxID=1647581 RepID=A0A9W6EVY1_9FLAO|nr:YciI family protein [Neptunitalea chrysea]GLB53092.1 hypothetical protein NBRC110019_21320 [Neptunitalea chrysea]